MVLLETEPKLVCLKPCGHKLQQSVLPGNHCSSGPEVQGGLKCCLHVDVFQNYPLGFAHVSRHAIEVYKHLSPTRCNAGLRIQMQQSTTPCKLWTCGFPRQ